MNPVKVLNILTKVLAEEQVLRSRLVAGGGTARDRLKLVCVRQGSSAYKRDKSPCKAMSRRTGMAYKAQSPGKLALFGFAQSALSLSNGHNITKPRVQEIG